MKGSIDGSESLSYLWLYLVWRSQPICVWRQPLCVCMRAGAARLVCIMDERSHRELNDFKYNFSGAAE